MIKLLCKCGKELELPDELAGRKIKCKHCDKVLKVPPRKELIQEVGELRYGPESKFYIKDMHSCPGCGRGYPKTLLICVPCGLNIRTGAILYSSADNSNASSISNTSGEHGKPVGITQRLFRRFIGR